jgi:hypothetical protein
MLTVRSAVDKVGLVGDKIGSPFVEAPSLSHVTAQFVTLELPSAYTHTKSMVHPIITVDPVDPLTKVSPGGSLNHDARELAGLPSSRYFGSLPAQPCPCGSDRQYLKSVGTSSPMLIRNDNLSPLFFLLPILLPPILSDHHTFCPGLFRPFSLFP